MHFRSACILIYSLVSFGAIFAAPYGLAPLRDDEVHHLEMNVPKVVWVNPNEVGAERIRKHLEANREAGVVNILAEKEFSLAKISTNEAVQMIPISTSLPTSVNNSLLPSFPPIGDQGQIGSCVAWGSTYYQATHEIGLLNQINNKSGMSGILSPKWTYDLLNNGADNGLSVLDAYQLLSTNGAPTIVRFPYDANYTSWDLNAQDWVSAISNRLSPYALIPGLGGSSAQNLTAIKAALANGHILTFATFIDSWVFTQIKNDPQNIDNSHVGEYAAVYMNGTSGGHFMTIVGYDDNLWIDVNGNGTVDSGERGAFLIANSWSSSWGNNGFIWISYDAFLANSAVAGGPSDGRVAAGIYLNSSVITALPKAKNYTPSLVAQFSLGSAVRDQISVQAGVSNTTQTTPSTTLSDFALANQGGALEFSGSNPGSAQTMTFALDFTDLIPSQPVTQRYYLSVADNASRNPTSLNSYSLVDLVHNHQITCPNLPKSYDNSSGSVYIDYDFATGVSPTPPVQPVTLPSFYINAGGSSVVSQGQTWAVDTSYVSGATQTSKTNTSFTNPIYQTERYGNMTYQFTVPNGQYSVTLKFAEIFFTRRNQRVFNVAINGSSVISHLDLVATAGYMKPYDLTFPVTVSNGKISIVFSSVINNPKINGIQIVPAS